MKKLCLFLAVVFSVVSAKASDFSSYVAEQRNAINSENWHRAIECTFGMINSSSNGDVTSSSFLALGVLLWISGNREKAQSAVERSIHVMRYSDGVEESKVFAAVKILKAIRNSSGTPSWRERQVLVSFVKVLGVNSNNTVNSITRARDAARYNALMAYLDSGIQAAKREGHRIEWNAKFNASRDYYSETGKSFDPSRRPSGGFEREKWDAAKRVYDIFD